MLYKENYGQMLIKIYLFEGGFFAVTILLTKVEIYSIIPIELVGNRKEIINGKFIRYKKFTCSSRR